MAPGPHRSRRQRRAAKSSERARKRRGRPGSIAQRPGPLDQCAAIDPAFRAWLVDGDVCPDQDGAADVSNNIEHVLAVSAVVTPEFATTAGRPVDVDYPLDVVLYSDLVIDDASARHQIVAHVATFLSFLHDAGATAPTSAPWPAGAGHQSRIRAVRGPGRTRRTGERPPTRKTPTTSENGRG